MRRSERLRCRAQDRTDASRRRRRSIHGSPALTVHGKMFACIAVHRSAEPDSLAVSVDFDQRNALITAEPSIYYLTNHYVKYPYVLVRLAHIREGALRDLLLMGWRFVSTATRREVRKRRRK